MQEPVQVTVYERGGNKPGVLGGGYMASLESILQMVDIATQGVVTGFWNSDTHYVDVTNGDVMQRPIIAAPTTFEIHSNDGDAVHITGIPVGTKFSAFLMDVPQTSAGRDVHIDIVVDDGILDWTTAYTGRYQLYLNPPWPYQPWKGEAIAIDPSL